ncbi:HNH endonuclease signature motif containing protein [Parabacteroides sp. AM08-6]|uniref:HNH endonuclease signature motif containing protein n=1 Tax=Parabacteroides sp. AM08-6 TaxID=2292053 RepID=UPI000F0078E7|nr:HNH endonuclease signature motif containing protein [Parabacteroides sp. AM08-6]RHJ78084.1 HNH endonuclease [Parabacteroides sp. AM08-6]
MATKPAKKATRMYGIKQCKKQTPGYNRVRSSDEYHTSRWTRLSRIFRAEHPLCEICKSKGLIRPAEVVDHIIPYPVCGDFFDSSNWQSLCSKCNVEKGNRDKKIIQEFKRNRTVSKNI